MKSACLPAKLRAEGFPRGLLRQYPRICSSSLRMRNSLERVDILRISSRKRCSSSQVSLGMETVYAPLNVPMDGTIETMGNEKLSSIARVRNRNTNGTFADGKLLSAEEKRERNRIKAAAWNAANPEKYRAIVARYGQKPESKARRDAWFAERPNYKAEHKQAALRAQAGRSRPEVCEIPGCGRTDQIHFDHDHETKKFRGWICQGCNKALGYVKDDPARLRRLAEYLEAFRGEQ